VTDRLLTPREAAERYRVSHATFVRWCQRGDVPGAFQLHGRKSNPWRIPESAVDANIREWQGGADVPGREACQSNPDRRRPPGLTIPPPAYPSFRQSNRTAPGRGGDEKETM
jgi:excisionase family DNA binding protein